VNSDIDFVRELVCKFIIDMVQLHGNEDEDYIKKLNVNVPVIKAVRIGDMEDVNKQIHDAEMLSCDYLLLDTYMPNTLGGIGKTFDWSRIPALKKPYFLAGGLNIDNIDLAKKQSAFALDLSSGIETDGFKDREKMIEVVKRVRNQEGLR
ncbi:MAG: phosphoribosylanthranilate isomerase, partial [Lachnospiraceae bacterium]|nr:phosphoribosylanthranilate isomerase [Lachnospiraceae bacterium]